MSNQMNEQREEGVSEKDLIPTKVLFQSLFIGSVYQLASGRIAWTRDGNTEILNSAKELPFSTI